MCLRQVRRYEDLTKDLFPNPMQMLGEPAAAPEIRVLDSSVGDSPLPVQVAAYCEIYRTLI